MAEEITGNAPAEPGAPDGINMAEIGQEGGQGQEGAGTKQPPAGETENGDDRGLWGMLLPFALIFVVFYLLLIRPQKKKEQHRREMLDRISKGDKVVTIGGIIGEISSLTDREAVLRLEDNTKIRITRSAVSRLVEGDKPEE